MNITISPPRKSVVTLEIELPADDLDRAVQESVRRLARRTRVPGFRPGKAPRVMLERVLGPGAVLDDAVEELVEHSYRDAIIDSPLLPLANPEIELVQAEEGKPLIFTATVPVRPEVTLGDYRNFPFGPEVEPVDDEKVEKVVDDLLEQQAILEPIEGRAAEKGDYAVIGFTGTRDGEPFEGGSAERMPLIIGEDRLIPGFEDELVGLQTGDTKDFDITFPDDYPEETLRGQTAHFTVQVREVRAKIVPAKDDEFARSVGAFADLAALRAEVRSRLIRSGLDRARHAFADRIIEYAVANASVEVPDLLVNEELEVMLDELRANLTRQGVTEETYLRVLEKTPEDLRTEFSPDADRRARTLLVLGKIAELEAVEIDPAEVEAEIVRARTRYADNQRLLRYFESERGRLAIRSSLRRSRVIEKIIDRWLADHPEQGPLPHMEDDRAAAIVGAAADAAPESEDLVGAEGLVERATLDYSTSPTDDAVSAAEPA